MTKIATESRNEVRPMDACSPGQEDNPVRKLASALMELRLASGELLRTAAKVDLYPELQIKAFQGALADATRQTQRISQHLAFGRENAGKIETQIREYITNLAQFMEQIASDYNDRPAGYPLDSVTLQPGWDILTQGVAFELTLAATTLKPEDMQMPAEDYRLGGLVMFLLLAQAYYKMLEEVVSSSEFCSALDLELNHSYFWVVTSLRNLLKNHRELKDFPTKFEPVFTDLYPSTIRDVCWDEMVAPEAESFLSSVQQYVHSKGIHDPVEGSDAWTFVELFRPSVLMAIDRAVSYGRRMREYGRKMLDRASESASSRHSDQPKSPEAQWITVTQAAELLMSDVSGLDLRKAKARVSKAASASKFRTNGKTGNERRIDRDSFSTWRLEQRERDLNCEEDRK